MNAFVLSRVVAVVAVLVPLYATALNLVREETKLSQAISKHEVSGSGITVAVLDRGIDWSHPDFINIDGTTRIKWMLDMSGSNLCSAGNPIAVEYTEADINAALNGGPALEMRDAVGHGTATAGTAAGNGRALADKRYMGIAPEADLIIVKLTSEGAPSHGGQPAEAPFQGCIDDALDWLQIKMDEMNQPVVAIINSGVQWGPMDGTSAVSRKLDSVFSNDLPGRILVLPSGDEGSLPNHARANFSKSTETIIGLSKASTAFTVMSGWYSGNRPAELSVTFDDGSSLGPVQPGQNLSGDGIQIINYLPGQEFYPWASDSGDRAFWISVNGHATTGQLKIKGTAVGAGVVDLYGDVTGPNLTPVISMTDHLAPGRIQDYATTRSAIVAGNHVIRTHYTDINGVARSITAEGLVNELWHKSSAGPTRDGRQYGVDVSAPGQNMFAPVGPGSWWASLTGNVPQGSNSSYIRFGGTSGSAPIVVGTVALMLQMAPDLTGSDVRQILRDTARMDGHTGVVPNLNWGWGKLDILAALDQVADQFSVFDPDSRPKMVRASDGTFSNRVEVTWNGVNGATVYRVFRCPDKGNNCGLPIAFPKGTSFSDTKAIPGRQYFYRVRACTTEICGRFSVLNAGHIGLGLDRPTGVKATAGTFADRVTVTFNLVDGATVYRVFRCLTAGQTCGLPVGYPKTGVFTDTKGIQGKRYYYRVRACNANGCSLFSSASIGFSSSLPDSPTGIMATDGTYADRVTVTFNLVDGATVYRVFRCLTTGLTCGLPVGYPKTGIFNDTKGDAGTIYFYRVRACGDGGCSKFSTANPGHRKTLP